MNIFGFLAISGMLLYGLAAVALVVLRRRRKRPVTRLGRQPKISILKPLKGFDDGLRDNLESFFNIDYPDYEIIFGASEADDPALFVARSLGRKYPDRRVVFSIGSSASGTNPKVRNLIEMMQHDEAFQARIIAAMALYKIGDPKAFDAIKEQAEKDPRQTVRTALRGLCQKIDQENS